MSSVTIKSILVLIAVTAGLVMFGVFIGGYYTTVILPPVIDKLDRGYEKIIQTQEIQNATAQKNLEIYGRLFHNIANNINITVDLIRTLDERQEVQNEFRNAIEERLDNATKQLIELADDIRSGTNIQLSQHQIRTDRELGDLNGNLTQLIKLFNATNEQERTAAMANLTIQIQGIKNSLADLTNTTPPINR